MSVALKLYEQITAAADDSERFRLIIDAIGALEEDRPHTADLVRTADLRETELRLQADLRATELRLQKEIEQVRLQLEKEIEQVRLQLQKEIEQVRRETEQVRRETERVRLEVERLRTEVGAVEIRLQQALHRQTLWIIAAVGSVVGLIRLLEYLLA
jgi:hypothetical protein